MSSEFQPRAIKPYLYPAFKAEHWTGFYLPKEYSILCRFSATHCDETREFIIVIELYVAVLSYRVSDSQKALMLISEL